MVLRTFWYQRLTSFRRSALRAIVPECVWPTHVVIDGVKFRIRGEPYSFGTKKSLAYGTQAYEADERFLISQFVAPGMVIFELGTSIGVVSSIIAEQIGPSGILVSVEASSKIGEYTKSWIEREYPWVTIVIGAGLLVWDSVPLRLSVEGFDDSRGSLGGSVVFGKVENRKSQSSEAGADKIWDLRGLTERSKAPAEALIVDIEGAEEEILGTALKFPKSLKWVMIELHPQKYRNHSVVSSILNTIQEEGFEVQSNRGNSYLLHRRM